MLSLSADASLKALRDALGDSEDEPLPASALEEKATTVELTAEARQHSHAAAMLCLVLLLKRHLKVLYQVSDLKLQAYDPSDTGRGPERQVTRLTDTLRLDTRQLWSRPTDEGAARGTGGSCKKQKRADAAEAAGTAEDAGTTAREVVGGAAVPYVWLRRLVREDEEEFDYNILAANAAKERRASADGQPKGRKRRSSEGGAPKSAPRGRPKSAKKRKKKKLGSDDEDDEDGDEDDEDYEDA